jgi:hypothetical protein
MKWLSSVVEKLSKTTLGGRRHETHLSDGYLDKRRFNFRAMFWCISNPALLMEKTPMPSYRTGPPGSAMEGPGACPRVLQCEKCRRFLDCIIDCVPGFNCLGAEEVIAHFPDIQATIRDHEAHCTNNG